MGKYTGHSALHKVVAVALAILLAAGTQPTAALAAEVGAAGAAVQAVAETLEGLAPEGSDEEVEASPVGEDAGEVAGDGWGMSSDGADEEPGGAQAADGETAGDAEGHSQGEAEEGSGEENADSGDEAAEDADDPVFDDSASSEVSDSKLTVTLDGNGADGGEAEPIAVEGGLAGSFTLPAAPFTREGYRFAGWSTTRDGHDVKLSDTNMRAFFVPDASTVTGLSYGLDRDGDGAVSEGEQADLAGAVREGKLVLYAQWEPDAVDKGEGSGSGSGSDEGATDDGYTVDASAMDAVDEEGNAAIAMTSAEPMGDEEKKAVAADAKEGAGESEGDGSKIESVSVRWLSTTDKRIRLSHSAEGIGIRVMVALSGKNDYGKGDVRISVPKQIFWDRDHGYKMGSIEFSVPEDPESRGIFNYADMGDHYVLTNTRKLSAATSTMFEMQIKGIDELEVNGNPSAYVSDAFTATATVRTKNGKLLTKTSDAIDATLDTSAAATWANTRVNAYTEGWSSSWPTSLKPENADDYEYIDWYSYIGVTADQRFDVSVTHDTSASESGGMLLGMYDQYGRSYKNDKLASNKMTATIATKSFSNSPYGNYYLHAIYAVPKGQRKADGSTYTFRDTATYKVTSVDDKQVTTVSSSAEKSFTPVRWTEPNGHFNVFKYGSDDDNGGALNLLARGKDFTGSYLVKMEGYGAPWTGVDTNGDGKVTVSELGQRSYTMSADDDLVQFDNQQADLASSEFEFTQVYVSRPSIRKWGRTGSTWYEGGWDYIFDGDASHVPDVEVWGRVDAGELVRFATISWQGQSSADNGATLSGTTVKLPANVTDLRYVTTSKADATLVDVYPTVRLKSSAANKRRVQALFDNSDTPKTYLRNWAVMDVTTEQGGYLLKTSKKAADLYLSGAAQAVGASKSMSYYVDKINRQFKLRYRTSMTSQTNIEGLSLYRQFMDEGMFTKETGATWYDLLPKDVVVDPDSVRTRSGDAVTDVKTYYDYKGSGRTLLVVKTRQTPQPQYRDKFYRQYGLYGYYDQPEISFDAVYSWDSADLYGKSLTNVVAYESDNSSIGTVRGFKGEPDDPTRGNNVNSARAVKGVEAVMRDLDPARDDAAFVYAASANTVSGLTYAVSSVTKTVSADGSGTYGDGQGSYDQNAYPGDAYTYKIVQTNMPEMKSKGIVLYDALEAYAPAADDADAGDATWRGTLVSVDTDALVKAGVDPVVWYSTKQGIDLTDEGSAVLSLDSGAWTQEAPADLSTVTAVAIDCRRAKGGGEYVLGKGASLMAYIKMRAPADVPDGWFDTRLGEGESEAGLAGGAHAYNAVSLVATLVNEMGHAEDPQFVYNAYTKVGLKPYKISARKVFSDDSDRDGIRPESVTLHLLADGVDTGRALTLSADNGWAGDFGNVARHDAAGNAITYSVSEDAVEGYRMDVARVDRDSNGQTITVRNTHDPELIELSGTKRWADDGDVAKARPEKVRLELFGNGKLVRSFYVGGEKGAESWSWKADKLFKNEGGKPIDYEVREEEYYPGYVSSVTDGHDTGGKMAVTNTYDPYGDLEITKTLKDATEAASKKTFDFTVTILDADGNPDGGTYDYETSDGRTGTIQTGGKITLADGQSAKVKHIHSELSYEVREADMAGFTASAVGATGTIRAGRVSTAAFTNTYDASGTVRLGISKELTGRALEAYQFRFQLRDADGTVLRTATCDADGKVAFGSVKYGLADVGKTYEYTIGEVLPDGVDAGSPTLKGYTYDTSAIVAKVTVLDKKGTGELECEVGYSHRTASYVEGGTQLSGVDGTAAFSWLPEGSYMIEQKDGNGYKASDAKVYLSVDAEGKACVTRVDGTASDVSVADDGTITWACERTEDGGGPTEPPVQKPTLAPAAALRAKPTANVRIVTVVRGNETSTVSDVSYTLYRVKESTVATDAPTLTNEYHASGTLAPKAWKQLEGQELKEGQFEFLLTPDASGADGAGPVAAASDADGTMHAKNAADGTVQFPDIKFDETNAGKTYTYLAREKAGDDKTVTYSKQTFAYVVEVVDNGDGTLSFNAKTVGGLSGSATLEGDATAGGTLSVKTSGTNADNLSYEWHRVEADGSDDVIDEKEVSHKTEEADAGCSFYVVVRDADGKRPGYVESEKVEVKKVDVKYAVQLLDIEKDKDVQGRTLGLTFGPATGGNYVATYKSHTPTGTTARGNAHRCLHNDDWSTIIKWASKDPKVYEQCLVEGCTHSVGLMMTPELGSGSYQKVNAAGDGFGALYKAINSHYRVWNGTSSSNVGGWAASWVRRSLNGYESCTDTPLNQVNVGVPLSSSQALIACFPQELRDAIQPKAVKTRTVYNDASSVKTTSDRLWLLSASEIQTTHQYDWGDIPDEGEGQYARYKNAGITDGYNADRVAGKPLVAYSDGAATGNNNHWWLRSSFATGSGYALYVYYGGSVNSNITYYNSLCLAPGFCLGKITDGSADEGSADDSTFVAAYVDNEAGSTDNGVMSGAETETGAEDVVDGADSVESAEAEADAAGSTVDGVTTYDLTLKAGQRATLEDIPAGTAYTVYEKTPTGWVEVGSDSVSGVVEPGQNAVATYTNEYKKGETQATITAAKTLDGKAVKEAGAYRFTLSDDTGKVLQTVGNAAGGGISFKPIRYTKAGTYLYGIKEVAGSDPAIDYDSKNIVVTVVVTGDGAGNLTSVVHYAGSQTFENKTNERGKGKLTLAKKVEGSQATDKEFVFKVDWNGGLTSETVKLKAGESKTWEGLTPGTTYAVSEEELPDGYSVKSVESTTGSVKGVVASGTAAKGVEDTVTFTNSYAATGSFMASAKKVMAGRDLKAGEFTFELVKKNTDGSDGDVVATATNTAYGEVAFDAVEVDAAGTYGYVIREVAGSDKAVRYDGHEEGVQVVATDRGDGTLGVDVTYPDKDESLDEARFENSLAPGVLTVEKSVVGAPAGLAGAEFEFTVALKDKDGNGVRDCKVTTYDGSGKTGEGTVSDGGTVRVAAGGRAEIEVPAGCAYEVRETPNAAWSVESTGEAGTMEAAGAATASFTNTYVGKAEYVPVVTKVMKGGELAEGQFEFVLTDGRGQEVSRAKNGADGTVVFDALEFGTDDLDKEHVYQVSEVDDAQAGVTYDHGTATLRLIPTISAGASSVRAVWEDEAGKKAEVESGVSGHTFTNSRSFTMPGSGAPGVWQVVAIGAAVLVVSAAAVVVRRKRRA